MQIQPVTKDIADSLGLKKAEGALVAEPQANGPAAKAGIEAGDVIISVDGNPVRNARELSRMIGGMAPEGVGQARRASQGRGEDRHPDARRIAEPARGERRRRPPKTAKRPAAISPGSASRLLRRARCPVRAAKASTVTQVDRNGIASELGFKTGDVILEVGGKAVNAPADVRKALADARSDGKRTILMRVKSEGGTRFVALPVGRA